MMTFDVSRETIDRLKSYEASLYEWQKKFNLVSNASLANAWERHFCDSAQLFQYLPKKTETLYDLGSGAGFPGLVLAAIAKEKTPYLKVTLIESIKKKTLYLKNAAVIMGLEVNVINDRAENVPAKPVDVITSRAMCALKELLTYAKRFSGPKTLCIFPKGRRYKEELNEAAKLWNFDVEIKPNILDGDGVILLIRNIKDKRSK